MKLVIDRSRWFRGEGIDGSRLLRPSDGRMCCLGFLACAVGATPEQIADKTTPLAADPRVAWPAWMFEKYSGERVHSEDVGDIFNLNDNHGDERGLTEIFARHGITVEFVDSVEAP